MSTPSPPGTAEGARPKAFLTKAEQEELARKARAKRKEKAKQDALRREQEIQEEKDRLAGEEAKAKWHAFLDELKVSAPKLRATPWLLLQNAPFAHTFLDALIEVLSGFRDHTDDLERIRQALIDVYDTFVDVARFARVQPAFYFTNPKTIQRLVRLLGLVAHKGSNLSLFPNILLLLVPTAERPHLLPLLTEAGLVPTLLTWLPENWIPSDETLVVLFSMFRLLTATHASMQVLAEDPSFEKLLLLTHGLERGFTDKQRDMATAALAAFPTPNYGDLDERPDLPLSQGGAAGTGAGGTGAGAGAGAGAAAAAAAAAEAGGGAKS